MAKFVMMRRVIEKPGSPYKAVLVLLNVHHIVSAWGEPYANRDGDERDGTRLMLSIGKTMLLEVPLDEFWHRAEKRHWWA